MPAAIDLGCSSRSGRTRRPAPAAACRRRGGSGCPSSPAWTATSSPRSKRTRERLSGLHRRRGPPASPTVSVGDRPRAGGVAEFARCRRRRRRRRGGVVSTGSVFVGSRRDRDVEVDRVRGDALHRPARAPEVAADDADAGAVIVRHARGSPRPSPPGSAGASSSATPADSPRAGSRASGRRRRPAASPGG